MTISLVLIIPADLRAAGNAMGEAFRYGPETYGVALSPTGVGPATHYGTHTWASDTFPATLDAAQAGTLDPLPAGVDRAALQSLVSGIIRSARPVDADPLQHFLDVLAANGLQRVEPGFPTP